MKSFPDDPDVMARPGTVVSDLPLFAPPTRARATDPLTSHEAAARAHPAFKTQRHQVLTVLRAHGPATYREIDNVLGWRTGAQRRLPELASAGLVRETGVVRGGCREWSAV